jgi:uncharacterized protein
MGAMRTIMIVLAALAAAACTSQPQEQAYEESSTASSVASSTASFDCVKAETEAEKLVCADPQLAALDRQLATEYQYAVAKARAGSAGLDAAQRGWVAGRDDCWKDGDVRTCVLEAYQTRLVELKLNRSDTIVPPIVEYRCDDDSKPLSAVFYNEFEPRSAVLTWGDDQAIIFAQPTASGIRYEREGVEYREHQGQVTVDFHGNKLVCSAP